MQQADRGDRLVLVMHAGIGAITRPSVDYFSKLFDYYNLARHGAATESFTDTTVMLQVTIKFEVLGCRNNTGNSQS